MMGITFREDLSNDKASWPPGDHKACSPAKAPVTPLGGTGWKNCPTAAKEIGSENLFQACLATFLLRCSVPNTSPI